MSTLMVSKTIPPELLLLVVGLLWLNSCEPRPAGAESVVRRGTVSWYSIASAIQEGTCTNAKTHTCLQANGQPLSDEAFTCASWDYPFGTILAVKSATGTIIRCVVSDRGPARKLYYRGRILDLSRAAFQALAPLSQGTIEVEVRPL